MASTGTAPGLMPESNGRVRVDLFKWLPFLISLIVFLGGYYALRQEVSDLKESVNSYRQETQQEIKDLRQEVLNLYRLNKDARP